MPRSQQTARKTTGGKAPRKQLVSGRARKPPWKIYLTKLHKLIVGLSTVETTGFAIAASSCEVDWDAVAVRLESHPEEAKGILCPPSHARIGPLAIALLNRKRPVPPNVVEAFLRANPKALESRDGTKRPLWAAEDNPNTSLEVWKILLSRADDSDKLLLHWMLREERFVRRDGIEILQAFKDASPGILHEEDNEGKRPIEIALSHETPLEIIRYLLEEGMAQNVGGEYGAAGLFTKRDVGYPKPKTVLQIAINNAVDDDDDEHQPSTDTRCDILIECFKAAGAALAKLDTMKDYPPIHGAIQCAPLRLTRNLISRTQAQDFHAAIDPLGRTALHVFMIAVGRRHFPNWLLNMDELEDFVQEYLIDRDDGKAARIRDHEGNLPLHYAAESGLTYDCGLCALVDAYPQAAACCNANGELPLHIAIKKGHPDREDGLDCIMDACPRAAICRDVKTGMYPFMLAGCAPISSVDTIYMMLREDPAAVQSGIRPSAQEAYLTKKHEEERAEWQEKEADWQRRKAEWQEKEAELERKMAQLQMENATLKREVERLVHVGSRETQLGRKRERVE